MQQCYIGKSNKKFCKTLGGHPQITKSQGEVKGPAAEDYERLHGGGRKGASKGLNPQKQSVKTEPRHI